MCGRCTGLRYWCEGKPAVRRAQHRIERLKVMRFHGGPVTQRPGRTMERREELMAALRRSKLGPHSPQFRYEVVATIACGIVIPRTCDAGDASLSSCQNAKATRTDGQTHLLRRIGEPYRVAPQGHWRDQA
jgi:hypothetical protein